MAHASKGSLVRSAERTRIRTVPAVSLLVAAGVGILLWRILGVSPPPPPPAPVKAVSAPADPEVDLHDVEVPPASRSRSESRRAPAPEDQADRCTLAGRVVFADGTPCRGGWIRLTSVTEPRLFRTVHVGPEGRFREEGFPAGSYKARMTRPGREREETFGPWRVETGTESTLTIDATPPDGLVLHLIGPDGEPVGLCRLGVRWGGQRAERVTVLGGIVSLAAPPGEPEARIEILSAFHHARRLGPVPERSVRTDERVVVIEVPDPIVIAGVVSGPNDAPVPGAKLTAISEGAPELSRKALSGVDGVFRLEVFDQRTYRIEVEAPAGYVNASVLADGGSAGVVIRLRAAEPLSFTVVDPARQPVPGASVWVGGVEPTPRFTSDESGHVVVFGADPGREYLFWLRPPRHRTDLAETKVHRRLQEGIEIEFLSASAPALVVEVVGDADRTEFVQLSLVNELTGKRVGHELSLGGNKAVFRRVTPGETYTVRAVAEESGRAGTVTGIRPQDSPVAVRLGPGATIRGRLSSLPGGSERLLVLAKSHGLSVGEFVDESGTFELRGLTAGTWDLRSWSKGRVWRAEVTVMEGDTVDVEIQPER